MHMLHDSHHERDSALPGSCGASQSVSCPITSVASHVTPVGEMDLDSFDAVDVAGHLASFVETSGE